MRVCFAKKVRMGEKGALCLSASRSISNRKVNKSTCFTQERLSELVLHYQNSEKFLSHQSAPYLPCELRSDLINRFLTELQDEVKSILPNTFRNVFQ